MLCRLVVREVEKVGFSQELSNIVKKYYIKKQLKRDFQVLSWKF